MSKGLTAIRTREEAPTKEGHIGLGGPKTKGKRTKCMSNKEGSGKGRFLAVCSHVEWS